MNEAQRAARDTQQITGKPEEAHASNPTLMLRHLEKTSFTTLIIPSTAVTEQRISLRIGRQTIFLLLATKTPNRKAEPFQRQQLGPPDLLKSTTNPKGFLKRSTPN